MREMDRDGAKRGGAEKGEGYAEENLIGFANFDLAFNLIKRLCWFSSFRRSNWGVRCSNQAPVPLAFQRDGDEWFVKYQRTGLRSRWRTEPADDRKLMEENRQNAGGNRTKDKLAKVVSCLRMSVIWD